MANKLSIILLLAIAFLVGLAYYLDKDIKVDTQNKSPNTHDVIEEEFIFDKI